jgi:fumarate hydratase subunit alpha
MREISTGLITEAVAKLAVEANHFLGDDVVAALRHARAVEESPTGREVLDQLLQNAEIARAGEFPLCQDTGVAVIVLELGQEVHITGGNLNEAVNAGVRQGYTEGFLRKSMVARPFSARTNTKDNTPAMIHTEVVPGDHLKITVMPKGGGCENMSALGMLKPADGRAGVIDFVVNAVVRAGARACPPLVVGVGLGGTMELTALLAKRALLRPLGQPSPDPDTAALEAELLARINKSGIGPQGFGGRVTALAVACETGPCHIASLPVAVNLNCHVARHASITL